MNKTLKISLAALVGCFALFGLGAWCATSFINPAQVTKLLSSSVKEATGRELKITGPVGLSIFPKISVKAEQVSLGNASWASNPNMLLLKQVELDIKLLPLLKGSVEIEKINVTGLEANLETNKAGDGNWNLTPPVLNPNLSANQSASPSNDSSDSAFVSFKTLNIVEARIHYQDNGKAPSVIKIPRFSLGGADGKSTILIDVQHTNYTLNLKGKTSSLRDAYFAWNQSPVKMDLDLALSVNGKSLAITGEIDKKPDVLPKFNVDLNSKAFDLGPIAGSAAIAGSAGKASQAAPHKAQGKYFFSNEALPFDLLPLATGSININISELGIPHQAPFTNFKATLQFQKDTIDASDVRFNVGKGSAQAQLSITQFTGPAPKLAMKGIAKDFTLEQIIAATDSSARVSGGDTKVAWNIRGSGMSPHQIASRATGAIQVSVGPSKLDSRLINQGGDFVITLFDAINPLYKQSTQTILDCAVAYLPINAGVVNIQNSVGVQTDRLNILLSGSVSLDTEAVNININPSEKSGLTTGIDLGGLVKIGGTLESPQTGVNKTGVVTSAASIGLGFLTGGISIAAENAKSLMTKSQPCKTALHPWSDIYSVGK